MAWVIACSMSRKVADRLPLRLRALLLAMAMGLILSLLFAAAVVVVTERYEHVLVATLLQDQAELHAARLRAGSETLLPDSTRQRSYLRPLHDDADRIPAHLTGLPPGIHEVYRDDDEGLHIGVFDTTSGRLYLEVDLADAETLEQFQWRIALIIVAGGIAISAALGWWLARGIAQPVRRLADAVDALPDQPQPTRLAAAMPRDALGRLALAIDRYQSRLHAADQAQQRFLADASHELRTPVAVVRGAAELLGDDASAHADSRPVLQRLQRGVDELTLQLDATLRLARRQFATPESVDVDAWLPPLIERLLRSRPAPVQMTLSGRAGTQPLAQRDAELVVTAGIQHLLAQGRAGTLQVRLDSEGIALVFHPGMDSVVGEAQRAVRSRPEARSDRGLAATIVGKLAAVHGWHYDDSRLDADRLRIVLWPTGIPDSSAEEVGRGGSA